MIVIEPGHTDKHYWSELWKNRNLLWILARRDLSVRYKQSLLGMGWAILRPLLTTMVMAFVFGIVAKLPSDPSVPYPLMILASLTIWNFFSNTLIQVSNSVLINSNLVTKVYFPRLVMPLSSVIVGFVDFLISLGMYLAFAIFWKHYPISINIVFLPFFVLLAFLGSLAFGLIFAVINIRFRDIGQLIPFLVQVGFYVCPIAYSSSLVDANKFHWWAKFYGLNPLVGIIDGFRWCLQGDAVFFDINTLYSSILVIGVVLFVSLYYFRKKENSFVDYI